MSILQNPLAAAKGPKLEFNLLALILLFSGMLAWLSVARYEGYNAGILDLGVMTQAIWSGTQGSPLLLTAPDVGPRSRLNVHVELIYYLLGPFYNLWPDPRTLLIIQALLFGLGAFPVYALSLRRIASPSWALCLTLIYLLYPTAQTSVLYDLHGDTLAMPLLLFVLDALDRQAWPSYAVYVALALSCKFYVALPLLGIGLYALLWGKQKQVGWLTIGVAIFYGAGAFFGIRPLFAPPFPDAPSVSSGGYLKHYFGSLEGFWATLPARILHGSIVFGPLLLFLWRGWRWLLPAFPIAAAALISTAPGPSYDYRYHHYALVVPFLLMATIDGVEKLKVQGERERAELKVLPATFLAQQKKLMLTLSSSRQKVLEAKVVQDLRIKTRNWRGDLGLTLVIVILCNMALVDTPFNPFFWMSLPGQGLDSSAYGHTSRDAMKDQFLAANVPPFVPLAASSFLAPHLANRETLYAVRYGDDPGGKRFPAVLPQVSYVLADALYDYRVPLNGGFAGGANYEQRELGQVMRDRAFSLVAAQDGLLLFKRGATGEETLPQQVETLPPSKETAIYTFGNAIELVDYHLIPLGKRRLRASFTWRATRPITQTTLAAISLLEGLKDARAVHLPTYELLPPSTWQPGQLIRETFEVATSFTIPPGHYTWRVGWYDLGLPNSFLTDKRSLLPGSSQIAVGTIDVPAAPPPK